MSNFNFNEVDNVLRKFTKLNEAIQNGMASTKECALDCEENEEDSPEVQTLKGIMLEYANMTREIEQCNSAVRSTMNNFKRSYDPDSDKVADIEAMFQKTLTEKQAKNNDNDLLENPSVKDFIDQVWKVNHSGINPEMAADGSTHNEEIVISQIIGDSLLCPITKTEMEQPMKNKVCGHSYGKNAIEEHIRRMKHRAHCPVVGCKNIVRYNDLEPDKVLAREQKKRHK